MKQFLFGAVIAVSMNAMADEVVLGDGRHIAVDSEMIVVPNTDARAALFIVYSSNGSKSVESVAVTGCLSDRGIIAHGPPSDPPLRVNWIATGQGVFDYIGRLMCMQTTSGRKYLELLRQGQQLLPSSPSIPAKFKWK